MSCQVLDHVGVLFLYVKVVHGGFGVISFDVLHWNPDVFVIMSYLRTVNWDLSIDIPKITLVYSPPFNDVSWILLLESDARCQSKVCKQPLDAVRN